MYDMLNGSLVSGSASTVSKTAALFLSSIVDKVGPPSRPSRDCLSRCRSNSLLAVLLSSALSCATSSPMVATLRLVDDDVDSAPPFVDADGKNASTELHESSADTATDAMIYFISVILLDQ